MRLVLRAIPVVLLLLSLASLIRPKAAGTVPLYAAREGLMCQNCHFDPNGGGPRNDFGFAYARNRHAIEPEDSTSEWHDLDVTNRIGDRMPVYLGVNQRFMLLANSTLNEDSLDRAGFFNMENALHVTFQPHPKLTLVYSRDGFNGSATTKDAFGMIGGLPLDGYLKAGRFRTPFGLRMDDHTVATRNGFLDFLPGADPFFFPKFLPYDHRNPDMGYELGLTRGSVTGRFAYTNGGTSPLSPSGNVAQAVTAKLIYNMPVYQGTLSFYDDFHKVSGADFGGSPIQDRVRSSRWAYSALGHVRRLAVVGEIAAGTDQFNVPMPDGTLEGRARNLLAGFGELNYTMNRAWNFRFRFDRLVTDRSSDDALRILSSHNRYAVEGEYTPVPFAEVRWVVRYVDHQASVYEDERQMYLQMHFSY